MSENHISQGVVEPTGAGWSLKSRLLPYGLLALLNLLCHGFILTNDGLLWDGWYWFDWLTNRNWAPALNYTSAQALPYTLWTFAPFAFVPNIVVTGMWVNFFCLLIEGFLLYELAIRLGSLTSGEALALVSLMQAMPLFSAAQDFPVIALIFYRMLFLLAALLAGLSLESRGVRHWILRSAALAGFYFSCTTNGALIVFYGGFYILLFCHYRRLTGAPFSRGARSFLLRYPDFFLVPPAVFAARLIFMPQFGWYKNYNKPGANLSHFEENFWSFFDNVLPYHVHAFGKWIALHPVLTVLLVAGAAFWIWKAPSHWDVQRGRLKTFHFVWFGAVLLFLAVFPLAVGGKTFDPVPVGETSRHCMLAALPLAILLFAALRAVAFRQRRRRSHWMPPVVAVLTVIFGGQYLGIYTTERAEWIFSRSVLHNAASSPEVRQCSVVLLEDVSVAQQIIYGTYGFATKFGERTRLVIAKVFPPANQQYYIPSEVERYAAMTSAVINEFRQIDPGGQQVFIKPERLRNGATDWDLVCRYLRLRYFGAEKEMSEFLTGVTRLNVFVLKTAIPMLAGEPRPDLDPSRVSREVTRASFTNGVGMPLIYLPYGWWAGQFETTQAQYEAVMGRNPSYFKDPVRPVECVTWEEACEFCRRLTESEAAAGRVPPGFVYRLPTVEEFEKLTVGSSFDEAVIVKRQIHWQSAPVGRLPPNALKLYDVFGNVWEWCLDWSDEPGRYKRYEGGSWVNTTADLTRFTEPPGKLSWYGDAILDQTYGPHRRDHPNQGFWNRGFRCVLAPPTDPSLRTVVK